MQRIYFTLGRIYDFLEGEGAAKFSELSQKTLFWQNFMHRMQEKTTRVDKKCLSYNFHIWKMLVMLFHTIS